MGDNDMVRKKRGPRGGSTASKPPGSAKATARRSGVKSVTRKLRTPPARAAKKQKPKSKQRTGLHAKGGGNAAAAGVTFQASVGAVFAVQMLTDYSGDDQLCLLPFNVELLL